MATEWKGVEEQWRCDDADADFIGGIAVGAAVRDLVLAKKATRNNKAATSLGRAVASEWPIRIGIGIGAAVMHKATTMCCTRIMISRVVQKRAPSMWRVRASTRPPAHGNLLRCGPWFLGALFWVSRCLFKTRRSAEE